MKKIIYFILSAVIIHTACAGEDPLKFDLDIDGVVVKPIPTSTKDLESCPCASKWLIKAKAQDLIAMYSLANCFGVSAKQTTTKENSPNYCEMKPLVYADWMGAAATRGFAPAQFAYGTAWFYGSGVKKLDRDKGIKWWAQAASQGMGVAYLSLGDVYEYGLGRKVDLVKAHALFKEADRLGEKPARERVLKLESNLNQKPQLKR